MPTQSSPSTTSGAGTAGIAGGMVPSTHSGDSWITLDRLFAGIRLREAAVEPPGVGWRPVEHEHGIADARARRPAPVLELDDDLDEGLRIVRLGRGREEQGAGLRLLPHWTQPETARDGSGGSWRRSSPRARDAGVRPDSAVAGPARTPEGNVNVSSGSGDSWLAHRSGTSVGPKKRGWRARCSRGRAHRRGGEIRRGRACLRLHRKWGDAGDHHDEDGREARRREDPALAGVAAPAHRRRRAADRGSR